MLPVTGTGMCSVWSRLTVAASTPPPHNQPHRQCLHLHHYSAVCTAREWQLTAARALALNRAERGVMAQHVCIEPNPSHRISRDLIASGEVVVLPSNVEDLSLVCEMIVNAS